MPKFTLFNIQYTPSYNMGLFAEAYLKNRFPALASKIRDTYAARPRKGLWITFNGNATGIKRVVRSKAVSCMRVAFRVALAQHGYGPEGKVSIANADAIAGTTVGDGTGTGAATVGKRDLKGSLVFWPQAWTDILNKRDVLATEMDQMVLWLESQQKGPVVKVKHGVKVK